MYPKWKVLFNVRLELKKITIAKSVEAKKLPIPLKNDFLNFRENVGKLEGGNKDGKC